MAPSNVSARVENSTVIIVQWNGLAPCVKVHGLIVHYTVRYTAESSNVTQSITHPGEWNVTGAEASLTGLAPFTNYSIQVAAVNEQGDIGLYSNPEIKQTEEDSECYVYFLCVSSLHFSTVPGSVVITTYPLFISITITWDPPDRPNGNIIAYEVSYRPADSSEPLTRINTTGLDTSFTTPSNMELGSEFIFSVTAYTQVGPGNTTSVTVSTLSSIREMKQYYCLNHILYLCFPQLQYKRLK